MASIQMISFVVGTTMVLIHMDVCVVGTIMASHDCPHSKHNTGFHSHDHLNGFESHDV